MWCNIEEVNEEFIPGALLSARRSECADCVVMEITAFLGALQTVAHHWSLGASVRPSGPSLCLFFFYCQDSAKFHKHLGNLFSYLWLLPQHSPTHFLEKAAVRHSAHLILSMDVHQPLDCQGAAVLMLCPICRRPRLSWDGSFVLNFAAFSPVTQLSLPLVRGLVRAETSRSTKIRYLWLLDRNNLSAGLFLTPCHQSS